MTASIPTIITHNYDPGRGPFRNICNRPKRKAQRILDQINASGTRFIKPNYLERRYETGRWLLYERAKKLGATRLAHPIYFFLGYFADGQERSRPQSICIPLSTFSPDMITFT